MIALLISIYLIVAFTLAAISSRCGWGRYFEPCDMWAWPIMVTVAITGSPIIIVYFLIALLEKFGNLFKK